MTRSLLAGGVNAIQLILIVWVTRRRRHGAKPAWSFYQIYIQSGDFRILRLKLCHPNSPCVFFFRHQHFKTQPFSKDLAIEMECEDCKWRWETNSVGYRISAEIISKQLVFPLITANHVAFASTEPVNEMSDIDLEKVWRSNFSFRKVTRITMV